jgi:surface-anchored protein
MKTVVITVKVSAFTWFFAVKGDPVRFRTAVLLPGLVATALAASTLPAAATPVVVLSQGHVDVVDVHYEDGALELHVHDETVDPSVEREPSEVLLRVLPAAETTVPADPAYGFLGQPGAPVWILPEIQNPELIWPGLSTEEIEPGAFAGDTVALTLRRVRGPGALSVFASDPFGAPNVLADSGDGTPDQLTLATGGHQHANWAFTSSGVYRVTFQAAATLADGTQVVSDPATYTFLVG